MLRLSRFSACALSLLAWGLQSGSADAQYLQLPAHTARPTAPHHPAAHAGPVHHAAAPHHVAAHHAPPAPHHQSAPASVHPAHPHPAHPHHAPPAPGVAAAPVPALVPVPPPQLAAPLVGTKTGLPLPRFASLRADAVNMRSGPGARYPIQWVYKRRDLPVMIKREFDVWRLVEDMDGVKGWVQHATLVGNRTFVVTRPPGGEAAPVALEAAAGTPAVPVASGGRMLRAAPRADADVVAILKPGVIGRLRACPAASDWCRVTIRDYSGWLERSTLWGLMPGETILPP